MVNVVSARLWRFFARGLMTLTALTLCALVSITPGVTDAGLHGAGTNALASEVAATEPVAAGFIVQVAPERSESQMLEEIAEVPLSGNVELTLEENISSSLSVLHSSDVLSADEAVAMARELASTDAVIRAEPNYVMTAQVVDQIQLDSAVTAQSLAPWGLDRIDQTSLPLDGTYTYDSNGVGVTAYVVDTGILATHSEFGGRVVAGYSTYNDGCQNTDNHGHGTHVAGILGGTTFGVAKAVSLVPVQVFNCAGYGTTADLVQGIDWIAQNHVTGAPAVASFSLSVPGSSQVDSAISRLVSDGVTAVVSAGNENTSSCFFSPSRSLGTITVNASDRSDNRASFSNFGACSDIYAPGVLIESAGISSVSSSATYSGTSQAAPFVAGVAALILERNPLFMAADVWNVLRQSAVSHDFGKSAESDAALLLHTTLSPQPVVPVVPVASKSQTEQFVRNLYKDFLNRNASDFEAAYWASELQGGRATPGSLTRLLSTSDEWVQSVIRGFYIDTLGREPDAAGYAYWIDQARNGKPIADIGSFFYGSDEYYQSTGQSNYSVWIGDLYQKLMLRPGDAGGIDYWVSRLNAGMSRPAVSYWFYQSPEKRGLRVDYLYAKLLNRGSDPGGRAYWAERLYAEGDLALASQIASSPEYFNRPFIG